MAMVSLCADATVRTIASRRPHPRITAILLAAGLLAAACSEDGSENASVPTIEPPTTQLESGESLPPRDFESLALIFGPRYEQLGMRVTRASLVEIDGGAHLQLYVEPVDSFVPRQYLESIVPTTAAVVPFIFDEWPDLASFDVCQEPPPGVDDSVAPEQVTVVALTRDQAATLDWPDPELAELMAAVQDATGIGEIRGNDAVEALPEFQAARTGAD